jgi:hypothetical protein
MYSPDARLLTFIYQIACYMDAVLECLTTLMGNPGIEEKLLNFRENVGKDLTRLMDANTTEEITANLTEEYTRILGALRQGLLNQFTSGLYHLFEQQLRYFIRHEIQIGDQFKNLEQDSATKIIEQLWEQPEAFAWWAGIRKLNLFANCAKHGEGPSCTRLRAEWPEAFRTDKPEAYIPFFGDGLCASESVLIEIANDLRSFWSGWSATLEGD